MISNKRERRSGAAAVEFAVLLPFICFLAVIGTDWARLMHHTITIEAAARAGAIYAADPSTQSESRFYNANEATAVESIVRAEASNLVQAKLVAPTISRYTGPNSKQMVRVTVNYNFTTITNFPGVPAAQTLSRNVSMQTLAQAAN